MEALAISSASPFLGAAIMGTFVLGTAPLFFGVGWLTSVLGDNFREKFLKIAAFAVLYLGIVSMNGALVAAGSPFAFQTTSAKSSDNLASAEIVDGIQNIEITVSSGGYYPNDIVVKKNLPVKLTLKSNDAYSCASAFRIPSLGIAKNLQPNDTQTVEFTPNTAGEIAFTCSMGMYTGVIKVI